MSVLPANEAAAPALGSAGEVASHLAVWGRHAASGLARVVYDDERVRRRAEEELRRALESAGVPWHEIRLPERETVAKVARFLQGELARLQPGVVSVTGFATAFSEDAPLSDSLATLNFYREILAAAPLRQVWWMPRPFAAEFQRAAPDTHSWFLVRLNLTETEPALALAGEFQETEAYVPLEEARSRARDLRERFLNAAGQGASPVDLLSLAASALRALGDAGAMVEARALEDELAAALVQTARSAKPMPSLGQVALSFADTHTDTDLLSLVAALNSLAILYWREGRYRDAQPLFQWALTAHERVLGPEHPQTAKSLNNLAAILNCQGKTAEAEPLHRRALAIREKVLGPEHPDTASSLYGLSVLLAKQGKAADAEPLLRRALAIYEKALGPDHPGTAGHLVGLAIILANQGMTAEAERLYRRALAVLEKTLGPEHPNTAAGLNNLANILRIQGRDADAEPLLRRALAIRQKVLGPEHPDTAKSLNDLAVLLRDRGNLAEAEPLFWRALAIQDRALGTDPLDKAKVCWNLAAVLFATRDDEEAEEMYARAREIREAYARRNAQT